jgi:hypothetical protein
MIKLDAVTGLDLDLYNAVHPIREGYIFDDFSNWTPLTLMKKKKKEIRCIKRPHQIHQVPSNYFR